MDHRYYMDAEMPVESTGTEHESQKFERLVLNDFEAHGMADNVC